MTSKREMKKQLEKLNAKKAKERAKKKAARMGTAKPRPRPVQVVEDDDEEDTRRFHINWRIVLPLLILAAGFFIGSYIYTNNTVGAQLVKDYYKAIADKDYAKAYSLCSTDVKEEDFISRVKNIYEGIEATKIGASIISNNLASEDNNSVNSANGIDDSLKKNNSVTFKMSMDTPAGNISFQKTAEITNDNKLVWDESFIYPSLNSNRKIRVKTLTSIRGEIKDRNDKYLAKNSTAYDVGIVPGKFNKSNISTVANLLGVTTAYINEELSKDYVGDDSFVKLKTISRDESELKEKLLNISGIMLNEKSIRVYPYKEATSILTGYVQNGEGKAGLELSLNEKLQGQKGLEIYIDQDGRNVETIVRKSETKGQDVKLTIDVDMQQKIYDLYKEVQGCVIYMNYNTGEVLSAVSTPSYDANLFSLGISNEDWKKLSEDKTNPMFNRYTATYAPGSSIKPIVGAIGLMCNSFSKDDDFGKSVNRWQLDSSWKDFYITTLHTYSGASNLENALINSDNIYFAKAALKIEKDNFKTWLDKIGFNESIEFSQDVSKSTYGEITTDADLANSGYGQAQMLVNPIHMASIYSSFANKGTMIKPYIEYSNGEKKEYKTEVFKSDIADIIKEDLVQVVEKGTAVACKMENKTIAGKTGTAEIKASQSDKDGTEIGWFDSFDEKGNLIIAMQENVKNIGGSEAVVKKVKNIYLEIGE